MKKTLIALAALAAVSAFAQSTVTLSGVADVSLAQTTGGSIRASANSLLNNGNSRITFGGTEDLGGGLKASFVMEEGVNLATGATDAAGTFQRNAFLAMSGNFGEVYAGRRLSPQFYAIASYELTGMANYSAPVTKFGMAPVLRNSAFAAYTTPNMGGFTATLGATLPGNDVTGNGYGKTDFNAIYKKGPLAAGFSYVKFDAPIAGTTDNTDLTLGASYDFGMAKVAVGYYDPAGVKKGFSIGATVPFGAASVTLDIARDTGSAIQSNDYMLEGKYALSKRTFVYAALYNAAEVVAGAGTVTTTGVGIRHNF